MQRNSINAVRHLSLALTAIAATTASALNYDVNYVQTPPVIDGSVSDAAWANASAPATGFVKHDDANTVSDEQTDVRLLWDDTHLYITFEAEDGEAKPSATGDDEGFIFTGFDTADIFLDPSWRQLTTQNDKFYHIVVDPAATAYTYTESGQNQLDWNLSAASQVAFGTGTGKWIVEAAIAWTDFNSTSSLSPGVLIRPPIHNSIWGAQFGRVHSEDSTVNNAAYTKWQPTAGAFRARPFGTLTFKGGPASSKVDISTGTVTYTTSFETPTFTNGATVVGIDGFTANTPANWTASDTEALTGNQALRIAAVTTAQTLNQGQRTTNTLTPQYMQYALRLPSEQVNAGSYRHVLYLQGAYSAGSAVDAMGQLWFRNSADGSNAISVVSFENPTNETQTSTTSYIGLTAYDTWMWVTIKADPVDNKFEIWVNDTKLTLPDGSDRFGVRRRSSFEQLAFGQFYIKNYGSDPVYVDDLLYVETPQDSGIADWQLFN